MTANAAALAALHRVEHQLKHLRDREVKEALTGDRLELVQSAALSLSLLADTLQEVTDAPHPRQQT